MQLLDTHVGNLNDGTVTVEFQGEGGELVSVRMATDGSLDGDSAVLRAKELMVQLTSFEDGGQEEVEYRPDLSDRFRAADEGLEDTFAGSSRSP